MRLDEVGNLSKYYHTPSFRVGARWDQTFLDTKRVGNVWVSLGGPRVLFGRWSHRLTR